LCKRWGKSFEVKLHPEKLKEINKIPSGSKVFVNSMSDLFHPDVPPCFMRGYR
jgi:protein gp37